MALDSTKCLVSLQDTRRYLTKADTDTADDRLIDAAVGQASVMIRKALGCDILDTTYAKELHGSDSSKLLLLNNWPLIEVTRVAIGRDAAATITYSGTGTHAQAGVNKTALRLRHAVSGAWTDTTLLLADYATMTLLAAAANLVTGWSMVVTDGYASWPSSELVFAPAKDAKSETVDLEVPSECEADYEVEDDQYAILYNPYGWASGRGFVQGWVGGHTRQGICVDYRAGYAREDMPEPLQAAALQLVSILYNIGKHDLSVQGESLGDYSYSMAAVGKAKEGLSNMLENILAPYRRLVIGGLER